MPVKIHYGGSWRMIPIMIGYDDAVQIRNELECIVDEGGSASTLLRLKPIIEYLNAMIKDHEDSKKPRSE